MRLYKRILARERAALQVPPELPSRNGLRFTSPAPAHRAPSGWVRCRCGFESSLFKSSARRPSVGVYGPASRIDRENAKVNVIKF